MTHEPRRIVNPSEATTSFAAHRMGVRDQHELVATNERARRTLDDPGRRAIILPTETLTGYRANVGDVGDAAYTVRLAVPGDTAWAVTTLAWPMAAAGRILGGRLWSSAARTAGTATLRVSRLESGGEVDHALPGATLDGVHTQAAAHLIPVRNGIHFAKGSLLQLEIATVSWAPTTADFGASIIVAYDGLD